MSRHVLMFVIFCLVIYTNKINGAMDVGFVTGTIHYGLFKEEAENKGVLIAMGNLLNVLFFGLSIIYIFGPHSHARGPGILILMLAGIFAVCDQFYSSVTTFWIVLWRLEFILLLSAIIISIENFFGRPYLTLLFWGIFSSSFAWLFYDAFWNNKYFMIRGPNGVWFSRAESNQFSVNTYWPVSPKDQVTSNWIYVATQVLFNGPLWLSFLYYYSLPFWKEEATK